MSIMVPVAKFEQKYSISSEGYIQSNLNNNILKPRTNNNGYSIVTLEGNQLALHRLVALHFIPNPYSYPQINHKDGDKNNNHYSNLEWCSSEQNIQHALKTGLRKGYVSYNTKLELMYRAIKGELIADLVTEVPNTHPNTLSRMLRVVAKKEGLEHEWKLAMKTRRKDVAISNIQKHNTCRN